MHEQLGRCDEIEVANVREIHREERRRNTQPAPHKRIDVSIHPEETLIPAIQPCARALTVLRLTRVNWGASGRAELMVTQSVRSPPQPSASGRVEP
jgi:hypothetical protein